MKEEGEDKDKGAGVTDIVAPTASLVVTEDALCCI